MQPTGIVTVALRTPTLPPATHTNTYIVGTERLSVFDPASPYEDEQQTLLNVLSARAPATVERIVLTHHHVDHVSGAIALQASLRQLGHSVPILAHPLTTDRLKGVIRVDAAWQDGETLDCGGVAMTATHTPGHAPGHLVFQSALDRAVIAGDMVAGIGTILIEPIDGDLGLYLDSLQRMRDLSPSVLLPSHGPALHQADEVLSMYIAHRHLRTDQIRQGLDQRGQQTAAQLVSFVYPDLDKRVHPIAALQIQSHLLWMTDNGLAVSCSDHTFGPYAA